MASRRSLISRQDRDAPSPQVQRARQSTALPPYEPPSCPLTEDARRSLADITSSHDYRKYERHLQAAITNVTNCSGDINDRLWAKKERLRKMAEKREATDPDAEKSRAEEEAEEKVDELEEKVGRLTADSEKALRDLIDYKVELAEKGNMVEKVSEGTAAASSQRHGDAAGRAQRRPNHDSGDEDAEHNGAEDDEGVDADAEASQAAILSPIELLKKAKEEHDTAYKSKSMRHRYADNNDYVGFKRIIHDAQHPGENKPPMPHASKWFAEADAQPSNTPAARRRRRLASNTDNTENGDDDDDEIQMTGVISSLKCPLTLKTFNEPYSNHVCKHTFEKSAILDYHRSNAVRFVDPSQGGRRERGVPQGPKQVKCPERGCDAMLELKDFYDDQMVLRQVKRQAAQTAAEMEDELESADDDPPQSLHNRGSHGIDGSSENPVKEERSQTLKRESVSQGLNHSRPGTPKSEDGDPELIEMEY